MCGGVGILAREQTDAGPTTQVSADEEHKLPGYQSRSRKPHSRAMSWLDREGLPTYADTHVHVVADHRVLSFEWSQVGALSSWLRRMTEPHRIAIVSTTSKQYCCWAWREHCTSVSPSASMGIFIALPWRPAASLSAIAEASRPCCQRSYAIASHSPCSQVCVFFALDCVPSPWPADRCRDLQTKFE